jgi:DNA-binding response OmpR family regulator
MEKILVVEDREPEMRLMVWHLTDDGAEVSVTARIGDVIADIETFAPDTVVFNSQALGDAKEACIALIRALQRDVRIIDVSGAAASGRRRFVDITAAGGVQAAQADDTEFTPDGLISMVNRRRAAG